LPWFPEALPLAGLIGGLSIGLAAALMLLCLGRIAGVSGLVARATGIAASGPPRAVAIAFILGVPLGAMVVALLGGDVTTRFPSSPSTMILGGLLVGFGTRLGAGCTSGHGVCGLARLSPRSIVATGVFVSFGFLTVALLRAFGGLR
jgi:uncharacterized membrane protein YedE/YeeE